MIIKPSTIMRNDYNSISNLAKEMKVPIYLTKNGEGDLVVMDITTFEEREEILNLREQLVTAEFNRLNNAKTYSLNEVQEHFKG